MKTIDPSIIDFKNKFSLKNKVVVITGGCGLIGKAFVEASLQFDAKLIVADLEKAKPISLCKQLEIKYPNNVKGFDLDISQRESVTSLLNYALKEYGKVDALVNAHQFKPTYFFKKFEEYNDKEWADVIDTNLNGTFLTCQIIGSWMAENKKGGCIINMPSLYSVVAPNQNLYRGTKLGSPAAYSASKGGIISLSKYLATYWAESGIRVNMITPHGVWNNHDITFEKKFTSFLPLRRMSFNHEVAPALIYLLSDASSFMTGHNLIIDGGWTTW